jgi:crossover junction endodeoxyribonuclease RuvC
MPKVKKIKEQKNIEYISRPENHRIVALDVSLEHTGVSIIRLDSQNAHVLNEVIEINRGKKKEERIIGPQRLSMIKTRLNELVQGGDLVIIEGYAFGAKGSSAISLGELGGVIRTWLYESNIKFVEIPPTQIKKFITGSGIAAKEIMLKEVFKRYGFDTNDNNLADAYAISELGLALIGDKTCILNAGQKTIVHDILNHNQIVSLN